MALLDGLTTLSETGGEQFRPVWAPDVYGLQGKVVPAAAPPTAGSTATPRGEFEDRGFDYQEIQSSILYEPSDLNPEQCREICLAQPNCRAWEVCIPYNPQGGCGGCYIIGSIQPSSAAPHLMTVSGWRANVERP